MSSKDSWIQGYSIGLAILGKLGYPNKKKKKEKDGSQFLRIINKLIMNN